MMTYCGLRGCFIDGRELAAVAQHRPCRSSRSSEIVRSGRTWSPNRVHRRFGLRRGNPCGRSHVVVAAFEDAGVLFWKHLRRRVVFIFRKLRTPTSRHGCCRSACIARPVFDSVWVLSEASERGRASSGRRRCPTFQMRHRDPLAFLRIGGIVLVRPDTPTRGLVCRPRLCADGFGSVRDLVQDPLDEW